MTDPPLRFHDTGTRTVRPFEPLRPGRAGLYACGPTVYAFAHIGNLRAYVFVDTLRRTLEGWGHQVDHVMNVTDVGHLTDDADAGEDKMELAARRSGRDIWDIARLYTAAFFEHAGELGILPPTIVCRATDHISEQIELVRRIEAAGFAYQADDGLYLDTARVPGYADFARLSLDGQIGGARVEVAQGKRNAHDFALWKKCGDRRRLMEWDSPWGMGFPGWHLECSAMSLRYLGARFDIHTGGIDHIPVHHTNEIAQMRAATGSAEWVSFWMHNNFLVLETEDGGDAAKMAKSAGGFLTLSTLRRWGVQPAAYRYFLLGGHYRKELRFSRTALEQAGVSVGRLWRSVAELREAAGEIRGDLAAPGVGARRAALREAMADDLNTPRALAELWGGLKDDAIAPADRLAFALDADRLLGLRLADGPIGGASRGVDAGKIEALIERRERARAEKNWAAADVVRDVLAAMGIKLKDSPGGTTWELED